MNKSRSYTAEKMYQSFDTYQVRSRGTANNARIKLTLEDIGWADIIFTMEKEHTNRIRQKFRQYLTTKPIITLFIKDIYQAMEPALIQELRHKLSPHLALPTN